MRLQIGERRLGLAAGRHDGVRRSQVAAGADDDDGLARRPAAATAPSAQAAGAARLVARVGEELEVDACRGGHRLPRPAVAHREARAARRPVRHDGKAGGADHGHARRQRKPPEPPPTPPRTPVKVPGPPSPQCGGDRRMQAPPPPSPRHHGHQPLGVAALARLDAVARQPVPSRALPAHRHGHRAETGIERQDIHALPRAPRARALRLFAPSRRKQSADRAGAARAGSPYPTLHRKFDLTSVPAKNSLSTPALSKPDMRPDVEAKRARRQHEIAALQGAVAQRRTSAPPPACPRMPSAGPGPWADEHRNSRS